MAQEYTFTGRIEDGRLKVGLRTLQAMRAALTGWRSCPVTVTVEKQHATRSLLQNAWYFGQILRLLSDHTGYTVDELHEYCKLRFNAKTIVIVDGNGEVKDEDRVGISTTRLNKITFGEYCERIRKWAAADLGVVIPDPDPDWRENAA